MIFAALSCVLAAAAVALGDGSGALEQARVLERKGDYAAAARAYEQALALNAGDAEAQTELGAVYDELNKPELAIERYLQALKVRPGDYGVRVKLAQDYTAEGQLEKARAEFAAAKRGDPRQAALYIQEGYSEFRAGDYAHAESAFSQAVAIDTSAADPYMHLGNFLSWTDRLDEARSAYSKALALREADPRASRESVLQALGALAGAEHSSGHLDEARRLYLRILDETRLVADRVTTLVSLGGIYMRQGDGGRAESAMLKAVDECERDAECLMPVNVNLHGKALAALARVYAIEGKKADAKDAADKGWALYEKAGSIPNFVHNI